MRERSGWGEGGETSEGGREHNGVAMAAAATSVYLETSLANQNSCHTLTHSHTQQPYVCVRPARGFLVTDKHTERKRSDTKAEHE